MRKKEQFKRACTAIFASVFLLQTAIPVWASEKAEIALKAGNFSKETNCVDIQCMLANGKAITNGKLRILYEDEKAQLKESKAGTVLGDAMAEINDCLSGNKEEGELVEVFASAQDIPTGGSLLDMQFQIKEGIKQGEEIKFEIQAEKLAGDSGEVECEVREAVYVVGEGMKEENGSKEESDKTENDKDTGKDSGKGNKSPSGKKPGKVKTGDENRTELYVAGCFGAAAVLGGTLAVRKKTKK